MKTMVFISEKLKPLKNLNERFLLSICAFYTKAFERVSLQTF